jgi:hypothetical protein
VVPGTRRRGAVHRKAASVPISPSDASGDGCRPVRGLLSGRGSLRRS